jgi:hypothetical protein
MSRYTHTSDSGSIGSSSRRTEASASGFASAALPSHQLPAKRRVWRFLLDALQDTPTRRAGGHSVVTERELRRATTAAISNMAAFVVGRAKYNQQAHLPSGAELASDPEIE